MTRTIAFSPYHGDTIKALQQRQADLAKMQPIIPTSQIVNPIQGVASVVDQLANTINEGRARRQEREATQGMAQLLGSFGPDGPTSEQIGQMAIYDPEVAVQLWGKRQDTLAEQARLKAQQEFQTSERVAGQEFQAGQTQAGYTHEGQVDTRELQQEKDKEIRAAATDQAKVAAEAARKAERPMTDAEKAAYGITGADAALPWTISEEGGPKVAGGRPPAGTTINLPGQDSGDLRKEFYKKVGGEVFPQYIKEAASAGQLIGGLDILDALSTNPQGPLIGRLAQMFPGVDTNAAAFESIVKRLAPQQRASGSGSTSDIEYAGMLASLPSLINNPQANAMISAAVRAQAQVSVDRGRVIQQWQAGKIDDQAAFAQLADIDSRSIMTPELKKLITNAGGFTSGDGSGGGGAAAPDAGKNPMKTKYGLD